MLRLRPRERAEQAAALALIGLGAVPIIGRLST
jgi:hypothetical protein